jgi:hypothetical protein
MHDIVTVRPSTLDHKLDSPPRPPTSASPALPALANASAATRVTILCKRNVFIVDCLSVHLLGIVHAPPRPAETLGQVRAIADLFSCRDNSLNVAADSSKVEASRADPMVKRPIGQLSRNSRDSQSCEIEVTGFGLKPPG